MEVTQKTKIESIDLYRTRIPIVKPYYLSFAKIDQFETFYCVLCISGREIWSEITPLFGYSSERENDVWARLNVIAKFILGNDVIAAREKIRKNFMQFAFSVSPFLTAMDVYEFMNHDEEINFRYPLCAVISGEVQEEIIDNFQECVESGYQTIKLKIGKNYKNDIDHICLLSELAQKYSVDIRLDANQAYTYQEAQTVLRHIMNETIEYLEQPLKRDRWDEMQLLKSEFDFPLLLDESIWTMDDLKLAYEKNACRYIKLKLYKHGGFNETRELIREAKALSLNTILGNGVQSDLGCLYEACLAQEYLPKKYPGEMNGFLKQKEPLLKQPLYVDKGYLVCEKGCPSIDPKRLKKYVCIHERFV